MTVQDFKRGKKMDRNRRADTPGIYKSGLPSSRQYRFVNSIPNASQRYYILRYSAFKKFYLRQVNKSGGARSREREERWKRENARRRFTRDTAANRGEIISLNYVIGIVSNVHLAHCRRAPLISSPRSRTTTIAHP